MATRTKIPCHAHRKPTPKTNLRLFQSERIPTPHERPPILQETKAYARRYQHARLRSRRAEGQRGQCIAGENQQRQRHRERHQQRHMQSQGQADTRTSTTRPTSRTSWHASKGPPPESRPNRQDRSHNKEGPTTNPNATDASHMLSRTSVEELAEGCQTQAETK